MKADDPERLSDAAKLIERELAVGPASVGEQRIGTIRVVIVPPLGMHFRVNAEDRQVLVLAIWALNKAHYGENRAAWKKHFAH
jgi:hypothetical protein